MHISQDSYFSRFRFINIQSSQYDFPFKIHIIRNVNMLTVMTTRDLYVSRFRIPNIEMPPDYDFSEPDFSKDS